MNGIGTTGGGYTGIGITGQDVLIYGNLLVTGGIDPTYLALTPGPTGPQGFINPLWVDNSGNLRSEKIYISQSTTGGATDPILKMENTNGNANSSQVELYKNSASPLIADEIGALSFNANNSTLTKIEYARIQADQRDITAGSENGSISVLVCENSSTPTEYLRVNGSGGTIDLYKGLNMGNVALTDSVSSTGTSGQYLTAGTGASTLWTTLPASVLSITAGSNIGITGTATIPIVSVLNPLTSTLNIGTQSITGSTSNITLSSGTNQANMNGDLGFTSVVQSTPTTKANLFNTSISVETSTNKVIIQPTSILKSVGATALSVGSVGSAPLNLFGAGGAANGVVIAQQAATGTSLTTNLSNVKYYADTLINNNNLNTIGVPLPQTTNQRLTLTNLGLTNTNAWTDYGSLVGFSGFTAFGRDSNGFIWLADAAGSIQVWDSTITTLQYSLSVSGASQIVNVFYLQGGYMWIGGNFTTIIDANGVNPQSQYSITRVSVSSYLFDPIFDSVSGVAGVQSGTDVFAIADINGSIGIGGNFNQKSNGAIPFSNIAEITNPYGSGGFQNYNEFQGGTDARVYAIYNDTANGRTYIGGDFTQVSFNSAPFSANYCAYFDIPLGSTWFQVANNLINASVYTIKPTSYSQILLTGVFTTGMGITNDYSVYIDSTTPNTYSDTNFNMGGVVPDYRQGFYNGSYNVLIGFDNTFYISNSNGVWTSLGQTGVGATTGIDEWNGFYKVIGSGYSYIRSNLTLPHSCIFTGTFKNDGTIYGNYTIVPRNVSQQFIGDDNNSFWSIIGQGVGTFS
jgi:hypothetical protein